MPPGFGSEPSGPFGGALQSARLAEDRLEGPGSLRYEPGPLAHARERAADGLQRLDPSLVRGAVDLVGRTEPPLPAGQEIRLDVVAPGTRAPTPLARVPIAADGTFALRGWRPAADGLHEVRASYESQSPELASDFSDPLNFNVQRPVPALLVRGRSGRPSPRGRIRIHVACPSNTAGGCRGRLRIERAGALLGSTRFSLLEGTRRTLRLDATRRARQLLGRSSRSVAARVRITGADGGERVRGLVLLTRPRP
ncbi:MAG: hypothetical protein M3P50_08980 [Actinomycetota bacterium]|nr:hypothetical protein [Actinomycetota bacterium]